MAALDGAPAVDSTQKPFGSAALLALGSRLAALYSVTVVVGVIAGSPSGNGLKCLAVAAILALQGVHLTLVLRHGPSIGAVTIAAAAFLAAVAALVWLIPVIGDAHAQFLMGLIGCGLGAGAATSWGPGSGALFTAGYAISVTVVMSRAGNPVDVFRVIGTVTTVVVAVTASVLLRRGFVVTERALASANLATTARDVARTRWAAQRRQIRELHDTVLSTLSLLAHADTRIDQRELRAACAREAGRLRGDRGVAGTSMPDPAKAAGDLGEFEELRSAWLGRSLDVQLYGAGAGFLEGFSQDARTAFMGAIAECLENVCRHAGVSVCSVVATRTPQLACCVVVDEGTGFDVQSVPTDRFGLAESVHARMREVGGSARVWSAAGAGTSVVLALPLQAGPAGQARR